MQRNFPFYSLAKAPQDAPDALVARIKSDAEAVAVSMRAAGYKQAWYAAQLGKSAAYISQLRNGQRKVPDWFVLPFCWLSGSNLLQQCRDLQEALAAVKEVTSERQRVTRLALELQRVAA